ncbi:hypothetical protein ACFQZV_13395 [Microbacterium koreense]|uniref:DUF998 domain-containing protein n=1 Tax=Microbacterium koreense TaxID=323761 RepID=A0ABW2ZUE3_9MICO
MSSAAMSTSLERTYRYLRLGLVGDVLAIFTGVAVAAADVGWLPSLSDYYFTSARDVFVGALIATTLALVALSGRGPDRVLLDAAAVFAPLIAVVPTTVVPGTVPGIAAACTERCFPREFIPDAATGVATYLVLGGLVVAVAAVVCVRAGVRSGEVWLSLAMTAAVMVAVALTWMLAREAFLAQGHAVATTLFFALFAATAVRAAFPAHTRAPTQPYRSVYVAVAILLATVLVAYVAVLAVGSSTTFPAILVIEAAALSLFLVFWVAQGIEHRSDPDPRLR